MGFLNQLTTGGRHPVQRFPPRIHTETQIIPFRLACVGAFLQSQQLIMRPQHCARWPHTTGLVKSRGSRPDGCEKNNV